MLATVMVEAAQAGAIVEGVGAAPRAVHDVRSARGPRLLGGGIRGPQLSRGVSPHLL